MTTPNSSDVWLEAAKTFQKEVDKSGMGMPRPEFRQESKDGLSMLERFDRAVTDELLRATSRKLFADGHCTRAVEEAFKCLNNTVKDKSGITQQDGAGLMRSAFSVNSPKLKLNVFQSQSDRDEQQGYMDLFAGSMTGIRNPRAHEHGLIDNPDVALELLVFANHLMRKLQAATTNHT